MGKANKKARARETCAAWNSAHPIGTPVVVTRFDGFLFRTRTSSAAEVWSNEVVIHVAGFSGSWPLSRIKAEATKTVKNLKGVITNAL